MAAEDKPALKAEPGDIKIVCGLGNPGEEYEGTRHNAGFLSLDRLAAELGVNYWKNQLGAEVAKAKCGGREILLVKPQAFMNTSGGPLKKIAVEYKVEITEILVIHDELDLDPGDVRIKFAGGHAGHNGLRSIIDKFGSKDFSRVRCSIGRPSGRMQVVDWVLGRPKGAAADQFAIDHVTAAEEARECIERGVFTARDYWNGRNK